MWQHNIHEDDFLREARRLEPRLYDKLRRGVLDPRLLPILWKDRLQYLDILQKFMVKYGFFLPVINPDREYLVPALLPRHDSAALLDQQPAVLVGYVIFAVHKDMQSFRSKGYVTVQDIDRYCFVPKGLLPVIIGEVVAECQKVHGLTIDDMQLCCDLIDTAFGLHAFTLRAHPELRAIQLVIKVLRALNCASNTPTHTCISV